MLSEAIILAGGLGTRLQSVVTDVPKCMAKVHNKPFVHYIIDTLAKQHIKKIIFSLGYKNEIITAYINTILAQQYKNIELTYVIEKEPLGTGGAILYALQKSFSEDVFITNGDTYFDVDISSFYQQHKNYKSSCSIALKKMFDFNRYGVVRINQHNSVISFTEKQFYTEGLINGGTYILNKKNFLTNKFPDKFSFEKDFLESYYNLQLFCGFEFDNYFIDIGIPEDYQKAQIDFSK